MLAVAFLITFYLNFGFGLTITGVILCLVTVATGYRFYAAFCGHRIRIGWALVLGAIVGYLDFVFVDALVRAMTN